MQDFLNFIMKHSITKFIHPAGRTKIKEISIELYHDNIHFLTLCCKRTANFCGLQIKRTKKSTISF